MVFFVFFLRQTHVQSHTQTNLACISPVDDLDPFFSCQAIHIDLVGVPAAVPLLLGPTVLEVELHLHLIYPLDMKWKTNGLVISSQMFASSATVPLRVN